MNFVGVRISYSGMQFYLYICVIVISVTSVTGLGEIIYAINAGGDSHVDVFGIKYNRDPLQHVGTSSDYGKQLIIGRVHPNDQILYQTERYHHSTFGYDVPIKADGDYVLVLKFCEVYFNAPRMKVCIFCYFSNCYSRNIFRVNFATYVAN